MEVQYKSRNGRLLFKIEGAGPKELFKGIAVRCRRSSRLMMPVGAANRLTLCSG